MVMAFIKIFLFGYNLALNIFFLDFKYYDKDRKNCQESRDLMRKYRVRDSRELEIVSFHSLRGFFQF